MPGKTYQFRVVGNSNHGPGDSSNIFELTTQANENIAGPVQNVHAHTLNHKSVLVQWVKPSITNGNITKYRVYYTEPDGDDMYVDNIGTDTEIVLNDLRPYTDYSIYVVPFNENGMGDSSNEVTVKTYSSIPSEAPLNITLEATSSTVTITCTFPSNWILNIINSIFFIFINSIFLNFLLSILYNLSQQIILF